MFASSKMRVSLVSILCALSLCAVVDCCSCPIGYPGTRGDSLQDAICSGINVYVATVTGATCNCIPTEGEAESIIYCHDYQLQSGSNEINVELIARGQCYGFQSLVVSLGSVRTCSLLAETSGLVIPDQGYTVDGPSNTTLPPLLNLTRSAGYCDLPCIFNANPDYYGSQGCFYAVTISEVIKGNYAEGQTVMVSGPDTTTTCGNPNALLKINEQYVVGVGSVCGAIPSWSTLQSYSVSELMTLRALSQDFEAGILECGATDGDGGTTTDGGGTDGGATDGEVLTFVPPSLLLVTVISSTAAVVSVMTTLF